MIQIFADSVLTYDSRLEQYALRGLKRTRGLNKGGTAEIVMPRNHPAYNSYTGYKTVVEIYRDGILKFRGRALYPVDDFYNTRTVVCEGELCFFLDVVVRPYLYQDTPAAIFTDLVNIYNEWVEPFKQFRVGTIDVTDPNDYVRLESESAEDVLAVFNKLLDRCGGYIVFTTAADGVREVNWLKDVGRHSGQVIEAGENLFSFSRSSANTDLATVLVPYGAKDEATGERVTITDVNGGEDYIEDTAVVSARGTIMKAVYWDDVTDPANLLRKARQYLDECKLIVTSLQLTALDLSYVDKTVDAFEVGDLIRVVSRQHGVDEDFQLINLSENMLNPGADGLITLGKEIRTLTDRDAAGDAKSATDLQKATASIKQDVEINVKKTAEEAVGAAIEAQMSSLISQTADAVLLEVSQTYVDGNTLTSAINTLASGIQMKASGSLGGTASIALTVNGATVTETLDLSKIREAFANDKTAVNIQGGTITFSSNSLIISSTNLQVSADGTITASNVELSGNMTTENGVQKSSLSSGRLFFTYDDVECGGISSTHFSTDASVRGVAVRVEPDAQYIEFSRHGSKDDAYEFAYCINYGANPSGRRERHVFFGSAYFSNRVVTGSDIYIANGYGLRFFSTDSSASIVNAVGITSENRVYVGDSNNQLILYGSDIYVGYQDNGKVYIQGEKITVRAPLSVTSSATFSYNTTFGALSTFTESVKFNANAFFANGKGVALYKSDGKTVFAMTTSGDKVYFGTQDAEVQVYGSALTVGISTAATTIYGSSITCSTSLTVSGSIDLLGGYGVRIEDSNGDYQYVLSMSVGNIVSVGNANCPLYLRCTGITIPSGNISILKGSAIMANGYGVCIRNSTGVAQYVVSMTSTDNVYLGADGYTTNLRGTTVKLASSGATVTSDRRKKNSIEALPDAYAAMLDKLTPVRFKFNDGTSGRYHTGFIAQEVQEALEAAGLTTQDFGGYVDLNGDGAELGLIYTEFIAILLHKIQRQEQRIAALEAAR